MVKKVYVLIIKKIFLILNYFGIIFLLKKYKYIKLIHWILSLFYIWDIDGLIYLDSPWWTYKAIKIIDGYLKTKDKIIAFEYGSGASTVWLARRVDKLYSIEHSRDWFLFVQRYIKKFPNVKYLLVKPDTKIKTNEYLSRKDIGKSFYNYVNSINKFNNKFDIIVIDGRSRTACLKTSLLKIKRGGIIVFDNCLRSRYIDEIKKLNNKVQFCRGLTPSLPYPDCTAIIYT